MRIELNEAKRADTIKARGLDMARPADMFAGPTLTVEDDRRDYGAPRPRIQDHQREEGQ